MISFLILLSTIPVGIISMMWGWGLQAENWGWIAFSYLYIYVTAIIAQVIKD